MTWRIDSTLGLERSGDQILADGLGAHVEEEHQKYDNDGDWKESSSGSTVVTLSFVPDEVGLIEEVGFSKELIKTVATRRHDIVNKI